MPFVEQAEEEYADLMKACKKVADILKKTFNKTKVVQIIQGFEVPHVHVHLIPAETVEECPFPPCNPATPEELKIVAEKIRS